MDSQETNKTNNATSVVNCFGTLIIYTNSNPYIIFSALATSYLAVGIGIFAVFGNSTFLYIVYSVKRLRTAYNILLVFLALTDLSVGLLTVPVYTYLGALRLVQQTNCALEILLKIFSHVFGALSLIGIMVLTVDRLLAVLFPLRRKGWNLKRLYVILYTFMFFITSLFVTLWQNKLIDLRKVRGVLAGTVGAILVVILLSYIKIYQTIKRGDQARAAMTAQRSRKKKSAITSGYITLLVIILYLPRIFVSLVKNPETFYYFVRWTALFVYLNSALNPLIYFYRNEGVQTELLRIIRGLRCRFIRRGTVGNNVEFVQRQV